VFQIPDGYLECEEFDRISEYVITKPTLGGRFCCVRIKYKDTTRHPDWVIGCPVCMSHCKYNRNALLFNICFVLDGKIDHKLFNPYENVVKKIAKYLATLEAESEVLFNESKKEQLVPILKCVFEDLNKNGSCEIFVNEANTWHIKIDPVWDVAPPEILDHEVPVPIVDLQSLVSEDWDPFILCIIPHIDGKNYVKKIQILSDVEPSKIKESLRHLIYYKCIVMADIFQYSNMYRVTEGIHKLARDKEMQASCMHTIILSPRKQSSSFPLVFALYCKLQPGVTMYQFCQQVQLHLLNINMHSFILFGVLNNIIKRVHKYPLSLPPPNPNNKDTGISRTILEKFIDGKHNYDEISVETGLPYHEIDSLFSLSINK